MLVYSVRRSWNYVYIHCDCIHVYKTIARQLKCGKRTNEKMCVFFLCTTKTFCYCHSVHMTYIWTITVCFYALEFGWKTACDMVFDEANWTELNQSMWMNGIFYHCLRWFSFSNRIFSIFFFPFTHRMKNGANKKLEKKNDIFLQLDYIHHLDDCWMWRESSNQIFLTLKRSFNQLSFSFLIILLCRHATTSFN